MLHISWPRLRPRPASGGGPGAFLLDGLTYGRAYERDREGGIACCRCGGMNVPSMAVRCVFRFAAGAGRAPVREAVHRILKASRRPAGPACEHEGDAEKPEGARGAVEAAREAPHQTRRPTQPSGGDGACVHDPWEHPGRSAVQVCSALRAGFCCRRGSGPAVRSSPLGRYLSVGTLGWGCPADWACPAGRCASPSCTHTQFTTT
jgi:hypothetical protein